MQESQRAGAGMCDCLCTVKWQTFFKCQWTLPLPPLSPHLKPASVQVTRLAFPQPLTHLCNNAPCASRRLQIIDDLAKMQICIQQVWGA